jgi:sulfide dehydrogenase cytochrome subunit
MRPILLAGLMAALPLGGVLAQSPDVTVLAESCATCHGPGLKGSGAVPSLKGQRAADLASKLKAFQAGERPATIMTRLSKGWSSAEIDALATKLAGAK